jgi:hypothetical protein
VFDDNITSIDSRRSGRGRSRGRRSSDDRDRVRCDRLVDDPSDVGRSTDPLGGTGASPGTSRAGPGRAAPDRRRAVIGCRLDGSAADRVDRTRTPAALDRRACVRPEGAYRQVKVIWNPGGDDRTRIWAVFARDTAPYHRQHGGRAAAVHPTGIATAPSASGWVPRGVYENAVGYGHLPGARLVYVIGRTRHSVGVGAMIFWRAVWYVSHLGPITSPGSTGTVGDPQTGAGTAGYGVGRSPDAAALRSVVGPAGSPSAMIGPCPSPRPLRLPTRST